MYIPLNLLFSRHKGIGVQFTDEPTGNLDTKASNEIMHLLKTSNRELNQTIIMITHNMELAKAGIPVKGISITSEELENYFLRLTGGDNRA